MLETADLDANPRRLQNPPRPRARALVTDVAGAIEQGREHRNRAERDGVQTDRWNEVEDGPPPVERTLSTWHSRARWAPGWHRQARPAPQPPARRPPRPDR